MHGIISIFITLLFLFDGICAKRSQTCKDLEKEISLHNATIEQLKLELLEYKLAESKIQDISDECTVYKACSRCLDENSSPNCGWCFLRNRCSLKENCHGYESDSSSWNQNECPRIRKITPHATEYHKARELELSIPHLPAYDGVFICSFGILGKSFLTRANMTEKGLSCYTPPPTNLPKIPEGNYSATVNVSVRTAKGPTFASTTNFTIFDCNHFRSCTECTSTTAPCFWCLNGNTCTGDKQENCRDDIIITGLGVSGPSLRQGLDFCPSIRPRQGAEIRVPARTGKRISVNINNIVSPLLVQTTYTCNAEDHDIVEGNRLGDTIYCDVIEFYLMDRNPINYLSFNVYWSGIEIKLDNPENIHVVVFDCSLMATSCSACLSVPSEQYNCGWCMESNSCVVEDQCRSSPWLDRTQKCTKPIIRSFYPISGLITREANITINGENFGRKFQDIDSEVRLLSEEGNLIAKCVAYKELYVAGSRLVCRLTIPKISPKRNEILKGFFEIKVYDEFTALSTESFSFVDPIITSVRPPTGFESGGTLLEIRGHHMDAGSKVEAFVGDFPCNITKRNSNVIRCITSRSGGAISRAVRVLFDGEERISAAFFSYVEDPQIYSVTDIYRDDFPSGSPSGGSVITAKGYHFDHIQYPLYFYVIVENEEYIGECRVESNYELKCLSPTIPGDILNFSGEESLILDCGFKMGKLGVMKYSNSENNLKKIRIYRDPFFMPFAGEGRIKNATGDYLVIEGTYLERTFNTGNITVEIGNKICLVTSISRSQLVCRLPDTQPLSKSNDSSKLLEVVVKVAGRMEFFIGFLRYESEDDIVL